MYLGLFTLGDTVYFLHQTRNSSNAPTDADSVPTYRVYELPSETPLTTGSTALFDDSNTTGVYMGSFSAAGGSGYEVAKNYAIRVADVVSSTTKVTIYTFTVV